MFKSDLVEDVKENKNYLPFNLQLFAEDNSEGDGEAEEDEAEEDDSEGEEEEDDEDTNDDDANEDNKGGKSKGKKKEKTFTQSQVNKMMAREKRQGKKSALREFGLDGVSKKEVEEFKKWKESKKTDEQKAAEKEAEEEKRVKEANVKIAKAELKAEALVAGVKSKYVDDVIILALAAMNDDEDLDAETAIEEIKEKHKLFFTPADNDNSDDKHKKGTKGTGTSARESGNKNSKKSLGARLAASKKNASKSKASDKFFK